MNAYAFKLQASKIPHSPVRDSRMAIEAKLCSLGNSFARQGTHLQLCQLSSAYANSGQSLWHSKDLPSLRADTKLRAERVTRRAPREDSDREQRTEREEYGGDEGPSVWDSNAENVRIRRTKGTNYSRPEVDEASSPFMRERNNRPESSRSDDEIYDRSGNSRWDSERSNMSPNSEWDYESEPPNRAKTKQGRQWWFGNDRDDVDEEEDEDYDQEDGWLSWLNVDLKDAFMLLRWGLPAAFLLCTAVIPVMIGNPLILLFGFSIFPSVVKWLSPLVKDVFRYASNPFESSSSGGTKRRSPPASTYSRGRQEQEKYSDFGSPSQTSNRSYDSTVSGQKGSARRSNLGGWEDLVEDRSRIENESQWPLQRRAKSGRKLVRKEQPFVIRIILAFFPFLRGWGGLF